MVSPAAKYKFTGTGISCTIGEVEVVVSPVIGAVPNEIHPFVALILAAPPGFPLTLVVL